MDLVSGGEKEFDDEELWKVDDEEESPEDGANATEVVELETDEAMKKDTDSLDVESDSASEFEDADENPNEPLALLQREAEDDDEDDAFEEADEAIDEEAEEREEGKEEDGSDQAKAVSLLQGLDDDERKDAEAVEAKKEEEEAETAEETKKEEEAAESEDVEADTEEAKDEETD